MTDNRTFAERRRDAAAEEYWKRLAAERRVEAIVLGIDPPRGQSVATVVEIAPGDYLVEVRNRDSDNTWTSVVNDKKSIYHFYTPDQALLHLVARRRLGADSDEASQAAHWAGRLIGY